MESRLNSALSRLEPEYGALEPVIAFRIDERGENWLLQDATDASICYILKMTYDPDDGKLQNEWDKLKLLEGLSPARAPKAYLYERTGDGATLLKEYIPGLTLRELRASRGQLDEKTVRSLGARLCDCLRALHEKGLLCCDLKPENVVMTRDGSLYFIDMDTARTQEEASSHDGVCYVTEGYAAPEQYGYQGMDARTDIFALGRLMAYLLGGAEAKRDDMSLRLPRGSAGYDMRRILKKCVAFSPSGRYSDANRARRALMYRRRTPLLAAVLLSLTICFAAWFSGLGDADITLYGRKYDSLQSAVNAVGLGDAGEIFIEGTVALDEGLVIEDRAVTFAGSGEIVASERYVTPQTPLVSVGMYAGFNIDSDISIASDRVDTLIRVGGICNLRGGSVKSALKDDYRWGCAIEVLAGGEFYLREGSVSADAHTDWIACVRADGRMYAKGGELAAAGGAGGVLNYGDFSCSCDFRATSPDETIAPRRDDFVCDMEGGESSLAFGRYFLNGVEWIPAD